MKNPDLTFVTTDELKIGMFVILPLAWHQHPFLKNHFLIESDTEIKKISELGLKVIHVDPAKSRIVETPSAEQPRIPPTEPVKHKPVQMVVTDDLIAVIHDKSLPRENKSRLVHQHSIAMMKNLLENPTAQNITEAKRGISEMVSLILTDDTMLHYLLDITSHDFNTYTHSVSVGVLSVALAKSLLRNSDAHDMQALGVGFFLHDVGKVRINQAILMKPGKLTANELEEMQRHPLLGYKLLQETKHLSEESKAIVLQHHERIDGTGYPRRLRGENIHLYGRICSIADVYEALTSDRPYRQKLPTFAALKIMQEEMGHHFQRDLFEQFVLLFKAPL
jgi:HD-GYP domain-containing protein (c-di-GMP phosphodiesterase class II)